MAVGRRVWVGRGVDEAVGVLVGVTGTVTVGEGVEPGSRQAGSEISRLTRVLCLPELVIDLDRLDVWVLLQRQADLVAIVNSLPLETQVPVRYTCAVSPITSTLLYPVNLS